MPVCADGGTKLLFKIYEPVTGHEEYLIHMENNQNYLKDKVFIHMENNQNYLKDKVFIAGVFLTSTVLFTFVFWLGFPGYFQEGDIYNSLSVTTNHWHPVFIARFIQLLYLLFGKGSIPKK